MKDRDVRSPTNKILKSLVILAILTLIIVKFKSCSTQTRTQLTDLTSPPLRTLSVITYAFKRIIPFASFREENRLLRESNALLSRKVEEAKSISDENDRLRALLDFTKVIPYATIPAQVIGRDPTNWSNSLIINKGAMHGIKYNRAALSTKGLVGRIVEVGRHSSKILLITDPNSKVGVLIQRNRQGGILMGRPDGKCKMIYISLDSDVYPGDKIITAGFGSVFPKGILAGEVIKVGREPGRLYKYAIIKPAQDLSRVEEVLCIR